MRCQWCGRWFGGDRARDPAMRGCCTPACRWCLEFRGCDGIGGAILLHADEKWPPVAPGGEASLFLARRGLEGWGLVVGEDQVMRLVPRGMRSRWWNRLRGEILPYDRRRCPRI